MDTTAQSNTREEELNSPNDDISLSEVISAWDSLFRGLKARFRSQTSVISTDLRLSVKAILVTLFCIMALVCLGGIIWVTLLIGLTYGLLSLGLSWVWCILIVLGLNFTALLIGKHIFVSAIKSIGMKASADLIFSSNTEQS